MRHLSMVLVLIVLLLPSRSHGAGDPAVAAQLILTRCTAIGKMLTNLRRAISLGT